MLTTLPSLQDVIHLERRYTRSVHLERDLRNPDSVLGYVVTHRVQDLLQRFVGSLHHGASRAWTITGVYGTGKSSAAHFLTALCSHRQNELYKRATGVLRQNLPVNEADEIQNALEKTLPVQGLICAVATAQREAIHHTVLRALVNGLDRALENGQDEVAPMQRKLSKVLNSLDAGDDFESLCLLDWIKQVHKLSGTGILIVIDELGKAFEYTAQYPQRSDLFLLQKLAEYPAREANQGLFVLGLLHQAFTDYTHQATGLQQKEWSKVQGRFEDLVFAESTDQVLRLIGHSIKQKPELKKPLVVWSKAWHECLGVMTEQLATIPSKLFAKTYPLHPLAALALPVLCQRYAQNERSLFTFLASGEPHALQAFLGQTQWDAENPPTLKLARVFDYFVESANLTVSSSALSQRWIEIQNRLSDAHHLEDELQILLKTIAVLNLVSLSGTLRARRELVLAAVCNRPVQEDDPDYLFWKQRLNQLIEKGFVTWWERLDELRIWQGSNFDINESLRLRQEGFQLSPQEVFQKYCQLSPLVAQRHSYQTGTLRYFERGYLNGKQSIDRLLNPTSEADGFLYYVLQPELPSELPSQTLDKRPILYLCSREVRTLIQRGLEVAALNDLSQHAVELRTDTVARKEVDYRLTKAQRLLEDQVFSIFHSGDGSVECQTDSETLLLKGEAQLHQLLSQVFDRVYSQSLVLWNELLNRQELTTQGAKARKEIIQRMLEQSGKPVLGIQGYGPERSMCESLLLRGGLYGEDVPGEWSFREPDAESGLAAVWEAMRDFCLAAKEKSRSIADLFHMLQRPPYGVKRGPLPVLLTALLQFYSDELSLFQDGTFIPVLGLEHFELLFRHPHRFDVKSFELAGFKASFFQELWRTLRGNQELKVKGDHRNETVLALIKPLVQFFKRQTNYTLDTQHLSKEARAFRTMMLNAGDPTEMLFIKLPQALGFDAVDEHHELSPEMQQAFNTKLVSILSEINQAYPKLLALCRDQLQQAFQTEHAARALRHELTRRAAFLKEKTNERQLIRFLTAVLDQTKEDNAWFEALVMVIADKGPQHWKDSDYVGFKSELAKIKHLFLNLEALQLEIGKSGSGDKEAKLVTMTDSNGKESRRILWIDPALQADVDVMISSYLNSQEINAKPGFKDALLARLAEKLLTDSEH